MPDEQMARIFRTLARVDVPGMRVTVWLRGRLKQLAKGRKCLPEVCPTAACTPPAGDG